MWMKVLAAVLLPFLGTSLGAALVFFLKGQMNRTSGVMVAASVWSLIIPAMD